MHNTKSTYMTKAKTNSVFLTLHYLMLLTPEVGKNLGSVLEA